MTEESKDESRTGMDRREAITLLAAGLALPVIEGARGQGGKGANTPGGEDTKALGSEVAQQAGGPRGTPWDPDLIRPKAEWPRLLTPPELATLTVLCDTIIPADERSPSAGSVGAPAYINEYVSAPYEAQQNALVRIRGGLAWLNTEAARRFGKRFEECEEAERHRICDDICYLPEAKPEFQAAARFFDQVRDLSATAFYTTQEGMRDLQYIGNVPLQRFDGPPPEVLRHLGLA